jgi:short-subunit dehydrogenase
MKYNILLTGSQGTLGKEIFKRIDKSKHNLYQHSFSKNYDLKIDFSNPIEIQKAENFIKEKNINCLINNAGVYSNKNFIDLNENEIYSIFNINLIAPIILSKYLYKNLTENSKEGLIINVNSLAGKYANYDETIYSSSKFGLTGFSSCLSINQKKSKIKVIDCHLGAMKTKMTSNRKNYDSMMNPDEIANFIVDLIESNNEYIISSFEVRNSK